MARPLTSLAGSVDCTWCLLKTDVLSALWFDRKGLAWCG